MAACRIFFFTYKRNNLMPRAIQSLLDQTFKDWICEVHNDCPGDPFPGAYIASLNDHRFLVKNHPENLGATVSFNLAFNDCEEAFISILEDDNWWQPDFLQEMSRILNNNPGINIAWGNMRIWEETVTGTWVDTGKTTWPVNEKETLYYWPDRKQAMGALHSNGAMLMRGVAAGNYRIPACCDFNIIESVRERSFEFPICLSGKVLANFSHTCQTARSADPLDWTAGQVMLLGSFIRASPTPGALFQETLTHYRGHEPTPVASFFLVVTFILKDWRLLANFNLGDWLNIGKWILGNILTVVRLKSRLRAQREVYKFLLVHTFKQNKQLIMR